MENSSGLKTAHILFKGSFWSLLSKIIISASTTLTLIFLARWLGPRDYGLIPITLNILGVFLIFADFGIGASVSKHIAEYRARQPILVKSIIREGLILKLIFGLTTSVLCLASTRLIANFMGIKELSSLLRIGSLIVFFGSLMAFSNAVFQGFQRFEYISLVDFSQNLALILIVLGLTYAGYGVTGVILSYGLSFCLGSLMALTMMATKFYRQLSWSDKSMRKEVFNYSLPLMISSVSYFIYRRVDVLMLGYFSTSAEVGYYSISQNIIQLFLLPVAALQSAVQPTVANLYGSGTEEAQTEIEAMFNNVIKYGLYYVLPIVFGSIALAYPAIQYIFGNGYRRAAFLLILLSVYLIPLTIGTVGSSYLIAANRANIVSKMTAIAALSNFVLNLYFIPKYNAVGAVFTTLLTHTSYITGAVLIAKKTYNISFSVSVLKSILKYLFGAAVMYLIVVRVPIFGGDFITLTAKIVIGIIVYISITFATGGISLKDWKGITASR